MKFIKYTKWTILVSGVLLALLGALSFFLPLQNLVWLAWLISISLLVSGIVTLIDYFSSAKAERSAWMIVEGVLDTGIAAWLLFWGGSLKLTAVIPYGFAICVLVAGVTRIVEAFQLKGFSHSGWGWLLALGILTVASGVALLLIPAASATLLWFCLSLLIFSHGVSNITLYVTIQRTGRFIRGGAQAIRDGKAAFMANAGQDS